MLKSLFQAKVSSATGQAQSFAESSGRTIATKSLVKYTVVYVLLFLLPVAFCFFNIDFIYPSSFFIGLQIYALILGIFHVWSMGRKFDWRYEGAFIPRISLTIIILFFSMLLFGLGTWLSKFGWNKINSEFYLYYPTAYLLFTVWVLMVSTFDFMMIIPDEEYKKWYYPERAEEPDEDKVDFSNSYVLTFEILKKYNERMPAYMKFKAPLNNITFGDLFYMYMYAYNDSNRDSQIEYKDSNQKPYGWLFYVKPKHWWESKLMIDPSLTVRENKIKENRIIVPYRVK